MASAAYLKEKEMCYTPYTNIAAPSAMGYAMGKVKGQIDLNFAKMYVTKFSLCEV